MNEWWWMWCDSGGGCDEYNDLTNRGRNNSQIKVIQLVFCNQSPEMLKHLFERPNQDNQTHYTLVNT